MKTSYLHLSLCLAATMALPDVLLAAASPTDVMFLDGGYSELCAVAAHRIENPGNTQVTGSRIATPPIDLCTLAIREDGGTPNLARNYNNRGVLLFAEGRVDEALADFEQAVRRQKGLTKAHVNLGYTYMALERWADAVRAFDSALAQGLQEDAAKVHFNRAIAHEELGEVREAYYDYRSAAELDPLWEEPKQELERFTVSGPPRP